MFSLRKIYVTDKKYFAPSMLWMIHKFFWITKHYVSSSIIHTIQKMHKKEVDTGNVITIAIYIYFMC